MKKKLILSFVVWLSFAPIWGQVDNRAWSPAGATWLYRGASLTSQLYYKIRYHSDTMLLGRQVKKLQIFKFEIIGVPNNLVRRPDEFVRNEYMYASNDSIFWYNQSTFQLLYAFGANVGDAWTIYKPDYFTCQTGTPPNQNALTVQSVQERTYSNIVFRTLIVSPQSYWSIGNLLIKNIGPIQSPFPLPGRDGCVWIDSGLGNPDGLVCYYDNLRGYVNFDGGFSACGSLITSLKEPLQPSISNWTLSPNPTSDRIFLHQIAVNSELAAVSVVDLLGKVLYSSPNFPQNGIETHDFPAGVYFVVLKTKNQQSTTLKFVKQ